RAPSHWTFRKSFRAKELATTSPRVRVSLCNIRARCKCCQSLAFITFIPTIPGWISPIAICDENVTFSLLSRRFSYPRNVRPFFGRIVTGQVAGAALFPDVRFRNRYELNENV